MAIYANRRLYLYTFELKPKYLKKLEDTEV